MKKKILKQIERENLEAEVRFVLTQYMNQYRHVTGVDALEIRDKTLAYVMELLSGKE